MLDLRSDLGESLAMGDGIRIKYSEVVVSCFGCTDSHLAFLHHRLDLDEVVDTARENVGYDEEGYCPMCVHRQAAEDAADREMRDRKAGLEDNL